MVQINRWRSLILTILFLLTLVLTTLPSVKPGVAITPESLTPSLPCIREAAQSTGSVGRSLAEEGKCLYEQGQYAAAAIVWQKSAEEFKTQNHVLNQAMALSNLSLTYQQLGQWLEAKAAIAESLSLLQYNDNFTSSQEQDHDYKRVLAPSLDIRGRLEFTTGKAEEALATWQAAGKVYQQLGDRNGEIQNSLNQVQAMAVLGSYLPAKRLLKKLKGTIDSTTDLELKATRLLSLGKVFRQIGKLTKSQQILNESLNLATRLEIPELIGAIHLDLGNTERALWQKFKAIGKEQNAQKYFDLAKNSYQKFAKISTAKPEPKLNLLSLLLENEKEELAKSQILLPEINQSLDNLIPSRAAVISRINFAESLMKLREMQEKQGEGSMVDIGEIAEHLAIALKAADSIQDNRAKSLALGSLGGLYEQNKQLDYAINLTKKALKLSLDMSTSDIEYRWQWQIGRLLKQEGKIEEAIEYYTAAVKHLHAIRSNLLPTDPEVQFSFRDRVEPVYRELVDLLLRTDGGTKPTQEHLKQAIEQIDNLQLAELENFLGCSEKLVKINQTTNPITDPKAAIIYPIILDNKTAIILQLPEQKLKYYETIQPKNIVETTLKQLQIALINEDETPLVKKKSPEVYNWLIKPLILDLEQNKQIETLVFVPNGLLRNIPMGVLYDGNQQKYLLQNYAIAIAPRLQIFAPKPTPQNLNVLTGGVGIPQPQLNLEPIYGLEAELNTISQIAKSNPPILNQNFTKENLKKHLASDSFSAIHIKTHGKFSSDPEETFIAAYQEKINSKDFADLVQLGGKDKTKPLELLVLSACETAQGDNKAVLGLAGIAVRLGSRSAISSLWTAQDERNTELMTQFYTELLASGITKAKALQMAQLSLRNQGHSPHIWANYILVGNWL